MVFLTFTLNVSAQKTISGKVVDTEGIGIPGVNVVVKGTTIGVATDVDGNWTLTIPNEESILLFSAIGMKNTSEKALKTSKIVMQSDTEVLDEVVVVAYGTAKRESLTGSAGVVSSKDLEKRTLTSIGQALDGATTGVQVSSGSGQPGSAPSVRVRGFGTLNGVASPLYVVDGVQFEGSLADINPDDIQSMTILKDASSTALYGARAANGVIMITTKSGKRNKGKVVFNFKAVAGSVSKAIPYYETVDAKDYYELMFHSYKNSLVHAKKPYTEVAAATKSSAEIFDKLRYNPFNVPNDKIVGLDGKINPNAQIVAQSLDWYKPLEQSGYRQNYNLSASGGGEKHDFYFSLGYLDEKGYVVNSAYERFSGRINANVQPKKWLKVGTNFSASISRKGLASGVGGNSSYGNPFFFARFMGPIYPVYIVNPETGQYILDNAKQKQYDLGGGYTEHGIKARPAGANNGRHIVAELDYNNNKANQNSLSNRSYAEFTIMEGLKASTNIGVDIQNYNDKEFENEIVGDGAPTGRYNERRYTRTVVNWNQLINYTKSIGDHNFEVLLGHESFERRYSNFYGMKTKLIVQGINEFDNFVTPASLTGYSSNKTNEGYFGRLKYNFQNKYYLEGSYRRDGSSVFSKDVRWGGFYSLGASWRLDQEDFIKELGWIDLLKLRASYGEVGNDQTGAGYYAYQALYEPYPNASASGLRWKSIGNSDLTWESNNSFDVALEFSLWNKKLSGTLEYYKKVSEDLLYDMPLALSMGLSSQPRNIATLYNEGFEIGLESNIMNTDDFNWNVMLQVSTVKNEITDIPSPFVSGSKRWDKGHSIYDYYLYPYYGVNPDNGEALYYVYEKNDKGNTVQVFEADGSPKLTTNYNNTEKIYTGDSAIPDLFGSFKNAMNYKNFDLSFMFTYALGGKIQDYSYAALMHSGDYGRAIHIDKKNSWMKPNDKTNIPRLENGNSYLNSSSSSQWLTDASYLSLKSINLGYSLNQPQIKAFGIEALRVFASAENVFILTKRKGMNPQQNFGGTTSNVYLPSRFVSFGVNITF